MPASDGITIVLDAERKAATIYNAGPRSLYLVRPDRIIAARRFDIDFNDIPALLPPAVGEDGVDSHRRIPRPQSRQASLSLSLPPHSRCCLVPSTLRPLLCHAS